MRIAYGWLIYSKAEFAKLSLPAICRRYGLGEVWIDQERDEQAEREVEYVTSA